VTFSFFFLFFLVLSRVGGCHDMFACFFIKLLVRTIYIFIFMYTIFVKTNYFIYFLYKRPQSKLKFCWKGNVINDIIINELKNIKTSLLSRSQPIKVDQDR